MSLSSNGQELAERELSRDFLSNPNLGREEGAGWKLSQGPMVPITDEAYGIRPFECPCPDLKSLGVLEPQGTVSSRLRHRGQ